MTRYKWISLVILVCAVCLQSCKQGCPDPKAYNYTKSAKLNDGSCLYCDSSQEVYYNTDYYVYDYNSASPYYQQYVLDMYVSQNLVSYSGNGCNALGKVNAVNTGNCTKFSYNAVIFNETAKTITYTGDVQVTSFSSQNAIYFHIASATVPPYGSDTVFLGSNCSQSSGISVQAQNSTIIYH